MDKWDYIRSISSFNDSYVYGYSIIDLLNVYNKNSVQDLTLEEVKEYYERMIEELR